MKPWLAALCCAIASLLATDAQAVDEFPIPGQPINIIVPYPAGGATDTSARLMAAGLQEQLHVTVQVINRPGAASQVGMTELARAKPDGMTLGYAVLPALLASYLDPRRQAIYSRNSFRPVATQYTATMALAVRADSPVQTMKDLVETARAAPGKVTVSDSGLLGTPHLTTLLVGQAGAVRFNPVHFAGGPPSVTALLGGQVQVLAGGIADVLPHARTGEFRVLGVAAEQADPLLPDVPTMRAQGYDVVNAATGGIVAPVGTPEAAVTIIAAAAKAVLVRPEHAQKLAAFGAVPYFNNPADYARMWEEAEGRLRPILDQVQAR